MTVAGIEFCYACRLYLDQLDIIASLVAIYFSEAGNIFCPVLRSIKIVKFGTCGYKYIWKLVQ